MVYLSMANNEHIQMKQLELIDRVDVSMRKATVIFGEASPKPRGVSRVAHFQVYEMQDASFVVISQN